MSVSDILYVNQARQLLRASEIYLSNNRPSDWAEQNRILTSDVSPFPGPFSYDKTPYSREIIDCCSPDHPAHTIAVMKGAQIGFSTTVIEPAIGYIISENPGNILFLTGHADLAEEAMTGKIDQMIDSCGLRPLIRPNVLRAKNMRTGDTNKSKEFPGGSLVAGSAGNHKLLRQRSVKFGFIDDFDAAKKSSKESGDTRKMIEQRFAAYASSKKLFYISTPELKHTSNIEPVYLLGDQRKYFVPCPCCGVPISLEWDVLDKDGNKAGITWELDNDNNLISESVRYTCQECGDFFKDNHKYDMNARGEWKPTAKPSEPGYYSYHLSALYAPPGMYSWEHYVRQYLEACPPGEDRKEELYKTFVNLCLGLPYEPVKQEIKANDLQRKNIRNYDIGIVPESLSIADGNGKIVLLTMACDLNGKVEDARLDWEVVAWSESGSCYSVDHGSIGTFVPREDIIKNRVDRERWTYDYPHQNNVWDVLRELQNKTYPTDTGKSMKVLCTGIDCGHHSVYAYNYIDRSNPPMTIGLKGKDADKYIPFGRDIKSFRPAKERPKLFLVEVGQVKDELSECIKLKWNENVDSSQPARYLNFPTPANGKYLFKNFFSHYESEQKIIEAKEGQPVAARWVKRSGNSQNHMWDVKVYNYAVRDIIVAEICKAMKKTTSTWKDYVDVVMGR